MNARAAPGARGGWWLLGGLLGIVLAGSGLLLNVSRVVLEEQPSRDHVLGLSGSSVFAQSFRAERPGLTQVDFALSYRGPGPAPRLRFRLREWPGGPERVDRLVMVGSASRHGYITVRFPPLPAPATGAYEFSLERVDAAGRPPLEVWGTSRDGYPHGVHSQNGSPQPDRDMTFRAGFRMSGWQALGFFERRLTAGRAALWSWTGTYLALLLLYGLTLGALLAGVWRMPAGERGPG
jgi:hypothetical protein